MKSRNLRDKFSIQNKIWIHDQPWLYELKNYKAYVWAINLISVVIWNMLGVKLIIISLLNSAAFPVYL